jgi:hypothetical protein
MIVRQAVEAGEKGKTLGDYVWNVNMGQVGDACAKYVTSGWTIYDLDHEGSA